MKSKFLVDNDFNLIYAEVCENWTSNEKLHFARVTRIFERQKKAPAFPRGFFGGEQEFIHNTISRISCKAKSRIDQYMFNKVSYGEEVSRLRSFVHPTAMLYLG
jgi:hypothetical protein